MKVMELGTTELKTELVRIDGKMYILQEANGGKVLDYRSKAMECAKFSDGKVTGVRGTLSQLEPSLLSQCLYETEEDGEGFKIRYKHKGVEGKPGQEVRVLQEVVVGWPQRIQSELFKLLKEISGMNEVTNPKELKRQIEVMQAQLTEMTETEPQDPKE